jgi:hypothetical protein
MPLAERATGVAVGIGRGGNGLGSWIRLAWRWALALTLASLLLGGCGRQAAAPPSRALPVAAPAGLLQEVPPPGAVEQIEAALALHRPRLQIASPAEDALLAAGPWQLALVLDDWPLSRDPSLGLGPHLVVQVDDGPGLRIGDWSAGDAGSGRLDLPMAELAPGSHRITAYAALPWGEAVELPGASAQLRVHRVAANPLSQPAAGSAQLLAVSPDGLSQSEPVLIDWLLRDAPLQGLREGDARWRLRISVNGDSFLVDQNAPLWLRGLKTGSNALQLELLDGLGEPLNPPFNSLVREVMIQPGAARPVWLGERIRPADLARLLGQSSPEEPRAPAMAEPEPPAADSSPVPGGDPEPPRVEQKPLPPPGGSQAGSQPRASAAAGEPAAGPTRAAAPGAAQAPDPELAMEPEPQPEPEPQAQPEPQPAPEPAPGVGPEAPPPTGAATGPELAPEAPQVGDTEPPDSQGSSTSDLVREHGSRFQPPRSGPLSGLAARLRP